MHHNKGAVENPALMRELMGLLKQCEGVYGQKRVFNRVLGLVVAEVFGVGRHTVSELLLTLGLTDEGWSSWYRLFSHERYEEEASNEILFGEVLEEVRANEMFVVGSDGFHVPRCSQTMPGSAWMRGEKTAPFRPGIQRGQRFVEVSWLTPMVNGYSRAIPLRCLPAFTQKAVPCAGHAPRTEVAATQELLHWSRGQMDQNERQNQMMLALLDGGYDTLAFWSGLPERTVAIVRSARNRALYRLPPAHAHGNRKYGEKACAPHVWLQRRKGFTRQDVVVRGRIRSMRYRVEGPFLRDGLPHIPLMLVVVGGGKRPKGSRRKAYNPCFFLVSAVKHEGQWTLPMPISHILPWLWQRWELEIAHRNLKSGLGLGHKQCWNDQATVASVQWSAWVYALMLFSGYRVWTDHPGPKPPGKWRNPPKRWSFNTLRRAFRSEIWLQPDFRATWSRSADNWPQNEHLWRILFNSTLASSFT